MSAQYFSVFEASTRLSDMHNQFMKNRIDGLSDKQADLLYEVLSLFTSECLDAYFLAPVDRFNLNGMGKKIVTGGVSAMNTAIDFALKRVLFKLSNQDLAALADHIESLIQRPAPGSNEPVWITVPLTDELYNRIHETIKKGRTNGAKTADKDFAAALCDVVEVSLLYYFEMPIEKMKMSFLMEKMARVASDTVTSGAKAVIRKVTPTMDEKEMELFFQFVESFIKEGRNATI